MDTNHLRAGSTHGPERETEGTSPSLTYHLASEYFNKRRRSKYAGDKDICCIVPGCDRTFYHTRSMRRHCRQKHALDDLLACGLNVSWK